MSSPIRRKCFTIEEKSAIIQRLEAGVSNAEISKEFGVGHSTVSAIWKNKNRIEELVQRNVLNLKRIRGPTQVQIDQALLQWAQEQQNQGIPVNGPMLRKKAQFFAAQLNMQDYVCTPSWINRFKARHNLKFGKNKNDGASGDWLKQIWPNLRAKFADDQIFIAAGTEFDRRDKKCSFMVSANINGTIKKNLLFVSNWEEFAHPKGATVDYNSELTKWLQIWNRDLCTDNNNILLLVNSRTNPSPISGLTNITLVPVPDAIIQPVQQGITSTLKSIVLDATSNTDIISLLSESWQKLPDSVISDLSKSAGFLSPTDLEDYDPLSFCETTEDSCKPEEICAEDLSPEIKSESEIDVQTGPTIEEALKAAETLNIFVHSNFEDETMIEAMVKIYTLIRDSYSNGKTANGDS